MIGLGKRVSHRAIFAMGYFFCLFLVVFWGWEYLKGEKQVQDTCFLEIEVSGGANMSLGYSSGV